MKSVFRALVAGLLLQAVCGPAMAQRESYVQQGEIGIGVGAAHYFGDINNRSQINRPKPAISFFYRRNFNNYIALRLSGSFAQLGYSDKYAKNIVQKQRNLSFNTNIWEGAAMLDFNFFRFIPEDPQYSFTPYISIGVGFFNYDPYAYLGGRKYFLRQLGTEGQNLPDSLRKGKKYGPTSLSFPIGMGIKYAISPSVNIGLEVIYRFTSTDYIDDVSTEYVGNASFPQKYANGADNPGYLLQDRSYEYLPSGSQYGDLAGRQRGFSGQRDHYVFAQLTVAFNLSSYRCPSAK